MMHDYGWHNGWFFGGHMWGMWLWPILLVAFVLFAVYLVSKGKSGPDKK